MRSSASAPKRSCTTSRATTRSPASRIANICASSSSTRAIRRQQQMALLFLDLDRFKVVNDTLGHELGDELLRAVVERLKSSIRQGDVVARLGGDEFAVLLEAVGGPLEIEPIAASIVSRFREPFQLGGRQLSV